MVIIEYKDVFGVDKSMEIIAGVGLDQAIAAASYVMRSNLAIEDMPTAIEKCCNIPAINRTVEKRLQFLEEQEEIINKGICIDAVDDDSEYGVTVPTFVRVMK